MVSLSARAFSPPLIPDAAFLALKDRVIERTGHFYYQDKDEALWERIVRRLRARGLADSRAYLVLLDDAARGEAEWAALETEITIGETFFFRYAEQFQALRATILPALLKRATSGGEKRLRVWSAGCSTGAEAYSVAILLRELLGEAVDDWRLSIVGTDIDDEALVKARKAEFGRWALRGMEEEAVDRYFARRDKAVFMLRPEYRAMVRFERLNLMDLLGNATPLQFSEFDLVLCRNVLIYFHPETAFDIVAAFRDRLVNEGWLLLGSAELNPRFAELLRAVSLSGTVAYRRGEDAAGEEGAAPGDAAIEPGLSKPASRRRAARPKRVAARPVAPVPSPAPAAVPHGKASELLTAAYVLAGRGEADQAERLCAQAVQMEPTDPRGYFYYGMINLARARPHEAERAFRRALYLDKSYIMAHFQLGFVLINQGDATAGRRFVGNAAGLAGALPPDAEIADGDGITAAALRDSARHYLTGRGASPALRRRKS